MTVIVEEVKENYLLICFDISERNARDEVRDKLIDLHAVMHTQSVYYVPDTVMTRNYLENWATREFGGIDIRVFELSPSDQQTKKYLHNKYRRYIRDLVEEFKETQKDVMADLAEFEEDIKNEKKTKMQGFHNKINSIENRLEELRSLINKFGSKKAGTEDEWNINAIDAMNRRIKERLERVKAMKLKVFSK